MAEWKPEEVIQDRWEILKRLPGGMGAVYVVFDREEGQIFAAKSFPEEMFADNPGVAQAFTDEATKWIALGIHPNVAWAQYVRNIGGRPFVFAQYMPEGSLSRYIGSSKLPSLVFKFAVQLCDAMIYVTSKGIAAHCDIKPDNCLVDQFDTLILTDFGLARAASVDKKFGRGTPEYMPPEQWDDDAVVDERSDIYAFGATFCHLLLGQPPFGSCPHITAEELQQKHRWSLPPRISTNLRGFGSLLEKCLEKNPEERPQSFLALRHELEKVGDSAGVRLPPPPTGLDLDEGTLINKGYSLDELGFHVEAIACWDQALRLKPDSKIAWANRGAAFTSLGNQQAALESLDRALALDPHFALAWLNKGNALDELGRSQEALDCYERGIKEDPLSGRAQYERALALDRLQRTDAALAAYQSALKLEPWIEQAWNNSASLLHQMGRTNEAMAAYDRALAINPRLEQALYNKAKLLDRSGKHEEAVALFDRAIEVNPQDDMNWYGKGVSLGKLNRHRDAILCYQTAIEANEGHEQAWVNLGAELLQMGELDQSISASTRAIAINPRNAGARSNLALALMLKQPKR